MSRARVDLGGSSSRSSGSSGGGGGNDPKKMLKIGGAVVLFLVAGGVIAWQAGLFEGGGPKNDGVFKGAEQPQAAANPEGQPAAQPTEENHGNGYGDEPVTAAAPPKRPERRGGGYVNPDGPKDPQ